jgi:hypothetical protein
VTTTIVASSAPTIVAAAAVVRVSPKDGLVVAPVDSAWHSHADSRQNWLFWGNIFSALWGIALIWGGLAYMGDPTYSYWHGGASGTSDGLALLVVGVPLALAAMWALRDAGGFKHAVYDGRTTTRKILYWLAAMFGLAFGVGLILAIFLGIAAVFGAAAVVGADAERAEARGIVSDGVTDAIRRDRGHR